MAQRTRSRAKKVSAAKKEPSAVENTVDEKQVNKPSISAPKDCEFEQVINGQKMRFRIVDGNAEVISSERIPVTGPRRFRLKIQPSKRKGMSTRYALRRKNGKPYRWFQKNYIGHEHVKEWESIIEVDEDEAKYVATLATHEEVFDDDC
jgi:hypothetical protein